MKKILLAVLVGVALTSCVKKEEDSNLPDQKQKVTFEPAMYKSSSLRATEVDFPRTESFGTFAYYRTTAVSSDDHSVFIDNEKVSYVAAATPYWAPEKPYYWPESAGSHLDFISYYPYDSVKTNAGVPQISMSDQQQTLVYNNFVVDQKTDLMFSDKAMNQTRNTAHYTYTGVPTLFRHALAKLNFKVKAAILNNSATSPENPTHWIVTIKKITIDNIYSKGTLEMKTSNIHDAGATTTQWTNNSSVAPRPNVWGNPTTPVSKTWEYEQVLTTTAMDYTDGVESAKNYFVLPQSLAESMQSITVEYKIKTQAPGGQVGEADKTKTVHFVNYPSVPAWEIGKNITYTIQIDPEGDLIHFAPAIVDWENANGVLDF